MGANQDEGSLYMTQFMMHPENFNAVDDDFDRLGTLMLLSTTGEPSGASNDEISIARDLMREFTEDGKFSYKNWRGIKELFDELLMLAGQELMLKELARSNRSSTYFYNYRYYRNCSFGICSKRSNSKND